jgi:hypothetical protein
MVFDIVSIAQVAYRLTVTHPSGGTIVRTIRANNVRDAVAVVRSECPGCRVLTVSHDASAARGGR